jgi:nucleoside-diphosphate-sugar epimerase
MKLMVTGSSGFVGRAVSDHFESGDHTVVRVVRSQESPTCLVVPDISSETDWSGALEGVDCVIHCAAKISTNQTFETEASLASYRRVNVEGTRRLAEQAAANSVLRLVFLSSVKVNGENTERGTAYTELDVPGPRDAYGQSKLEAEQALMEVAQKTGLEVVIIRPPLVYGPGVKGSFATLVKWVRKGIPLPFGIVHNRRSLIALDNLVNFIAFCADRERSPHAANQVLLVSDGEDVSTTELLCKVARTYGVKARLLPIPVNWIKLPARLLGKSAIADRLLESLQVNSSKATNLLGWAPVVTMDEQLRKMAQHDTPI